jgi:hypothetical protein
MKTNWVVVLCFTIFAVAGEASTVYTFTGSAGGDSENATVEFTLSNCVTAPSTSCQLDIVITNLVTSPGDAGQGIIGLSFNIASLTTAGTLNSTITNGSGGAVPEIDLSSGASDGSTNSAPEWTFGHSTSSNPGCLASDVFCLDGHSLGGAPTEMIIGAGASGGNASVNNFNPYLSGPVDFQIDNFAGLTLASTFSNVQLDFGTGPDGTLNGDPCVTDCGGGGIQSLAPEPFSFLLVGSGLALLGLRRLRS